MALVMLSKRSKKMLVARRSHDARDGTISKEFKVNAGH